MPIGRKSDPTTGVLVSGLSDAIPDLEIFFVDLVRATPFLEAEENERPRLSDPDIERAAAMVDGAAARSWRSTRIATRILLERAAGPDVRRALFEIEPSGRPVLVGGPHFSVSHTDGVALVAVSKAAPIGVDIEAITRPLKMSADRRERIIHAADRYAPRASLSAASDADILAAWVLLEAAAKALGTGIGRLLTEEGVVGGVKSQRETSAPRAVVTRMLRVEDGYVAAIAAERLPDVLMVERFPEEKIETFARGGPA